jgi:Tetratricopeptide repeat
VTPEERSGSGTFVYHPLLPTSPLSELWRASRGHAAAPLAVPSESVARQYRVHLGAHMRTAPGGKTIILPDRLDEDNRPLVREFRAFFPAFLERCGGPPQVGSSVHFPSVGFFDARAVERGEERATFVTSRVVDAVEMFARTMSMCARLNGLAMDELLAAEDTPPKIVPLAWIALQQYGVPGFALDQVDGVFAAQNPASLLRSDLFSSSSLPPDAARAISRYRLTHYLAQAMLIGLEHLVEGRIEDAAPWLECARPPEAADVPMTIDATYLANLVLAFIALHEQAHVLHNHNSFELAPGDPQIDAIAKAAMRHAAEDGDATALDLRGLTLQLEQDADCFPFEVAPEDYRDALLEASSLWLAALAAADRGGHDWLKAFVDAQGRAHPRYAMRVWFINGRYSSGSRAGEVARTAHRTAEAIQAQESVQDRHAPDEVFSVFKALWGIACDEVGEGARAGRSPEDPSTLTTLNNIAVGLYQAGDLDAASETMANVLDARLRVLGEGHPETLETMSSLAVILTDMGDLTRAIDLGERAVMGFKRVLGPRHPRTGQAFLSLFAALGKADQSTTRAVIARVAPNGPGEFFET